jgi:hypothetical protein
VGESLSWLHKEIEQVVGVLTNGKTGRCGGCADLAVKRTNRQ